MRFLANYGIQKGKDLMRVLGKESALNLNLLMLAILIMACIGAGGIKLWYQTYDPTEALNPLSVVPVSETDLQSASVCARDIIGAELRQGLSPSRSKLFYTEWQCDIAVSSQ